MTHATSQAPAGQRNRQWLLVDRPVGVPGPKHFDLVTKPMPSIPEGGFLVRNVYISIDAAQRGYVNDEQNYLPPLPLGSVMRSLAVGRVVESRNAEVRVGEHLYGWFGWQDYCAALPSSILRRVDETQAPLSAAAGLLGINGLAAYLAMTEVGRPSPGDTVFVTVAAGAVGSLAGQIARLMGCRVVGTAGTTAKIERCSAEFGYDCCLDYRSADFAAALRTACPAGIDVFFDNSGGPVADLVIRHMNAFGRVVQCGTIATTSWSPAPQGPRLEREILARRLRVEGFVVFDHAARFDRAAARLAHLHSLNLLRCREEISEGLERAPQALADLYAGLNSGKLLVRV
jgi:NADPH-dependent curcumin reductase CurA